MRSLHALVALAAFGSPLFALPGVGILCVRRHLAKPHTSRSRAGEGNFTSVQGACQASTTFGDGSGIFYARIEAIPCYAPSPLGTRFDDAETA